MQIERHVRRIGQAEVSMNSLESKRITVGEIARELAVSIPTVYAMLRERKIPNIRQGKLFIVSREAFGRWLGTCGMGMDAP
jgi:excisionase family DNA binding protein